MPVSFSKESVWGFGFQFDTKNHLFNKGLMNIRKIIFYVILLFQVGYLYFTYKQIIFIDKLQKNLKNDFYNINVSFEEFSIIKKKIDCSKEIILLFNPTEEQSKFHLNFAANYAFAPCITKVLLTPETIKPLKNSFLILENSHPSYEQIVSEKHEEKIQLNHVTFVRW